MSRDGITVLVIDDHPTNRKLLSLALATDGFAVLTAGTGELGLEAVRSERPALVYADLQLPGIDGLEVARRIKADRDTADTVVVALTAFAMAADRDRAFAAGCDGFLAKPINTRTLGFATDQFLAAGPRPRNAAARGE
jgi:CheY-like chemotaxis protein